jgi:hypothetical protein
MRELRLASRKWNWAFGAVLIINSQTDGRGESAADIAYPRQRMTRQTRGLLILGTLGVLLVLFASGWRYLDSFSALFQARVISFEEPPAAAPLAKIRITKVNGVTTEIFATLAAGVQLAATVNLSLFDGFEPRMSPDEARRLHGPPSGEWTDPYYG